MVFSTTKGGIKSLGASVCHLGGTVPLILLLFQQLHLMLCDCIVTEICSVIVNPCSFSMPRSKKAGRSLKDKTARRSHRTQRRKGRFLVVRRCQPPVPRPSRGHIFPPPPTTFPPLLIAKNSILLSKEWERNTPYKENDMDAVFFRKIFFCSPLYWLMSFWANFVAPVFISASQLHKKNSRGSYDCVCFGIHEQVGHGTIHWTPATKWNNFFAKTQLLLFSPLFAMVTEMVQTYYPDLAKDLIKDTPAEYRLFGLFTYGMFHLSPVELAHIDYNNHGVCVVIPLGSSYTGGMLSFNYLNVQYHMQPGDMIIFRSSKLLHSVTNVISGLRQSLVLTSQNIVIDKIKSGAVPSLLWANINKPHSRNKRIARVSWLNSERGITNSQFSICM